MSIQNFQIPCTGTSLNHFCLAESHNSLRVDTVISAADECVSAAGPSRGRHSRDYVVLSTTNKEDSIDKEIRYVLTYLIAHLLTHLLTYLLTYLLTQVLFACPQRVLLYHHQSRRYRRKLRTCVR